MAICLLADRIFEERERIRLYGEVEWYAIHVRPRFDPVVAVHLKKQNVEHNLPLRRVSTLQHRFYQTTITAGSCLLLR